MPKVTINVNGEEKEVNIGHEDDFKEMENQFEKMGNRFEEKIEKATKKVKKHIKSIFDFRARIVSATPIICLALYLTIGFVFHVWHPTWLIFMLIPIMPTVLYGFKKGKNIVMLVTTLITFITFLALGFSGYWHPGWLVLFIIPIVSALTPSNNHKK